MLLRPGELALGSSLSVHSRFVVPYLLFCGIVITVISSFLISLTSPAMVIVTLPDFSHELSKKVVTGYKQSIILFLANHL